MTHIRRRLRDAILPVLLLLAACGEDGTDLEAVARDDLFGEWVATTLLTTVGGQTLDQLVAGAELQLTLLEDGTTTGRLFVPGAGTLGTDLEVDLTGVWTFDDDEGEVDLDHSADSFVRDLTFEAVRADGGIELRAERTFQASGTTVEVVLERDP